MRMFAHCTPPFSRQRGIVCEVNTTKALSILAPLYALRLSPIFVSIIGVDDDDDDATRPACCASSARFCAQ